MGLTIHYRLRSSARNTVLRKVEAMRQFALDLPFEEVSDVRYLSPEICGKGFEYYRDRDEETFSGLVWNSLHVRVPWSKKVSRSLSVDPVESYIFWVYPGHGCESAMLGLSRYPKEVPYTYTPEEDDRFVHAFRNGGMRHTRFDYDKWSRWNWRGHKGYRTPSDMEEERMIRVHQPGWQLGSFCKTQYASDPTCGGIPNFLRCHVGMITLLDKIATIPTLKVKVDDEGHYGGATYTDTPYAKERVYTWHEPTYSVPTLLQQCDEYNTMIAALGGCLKDALGDGLEMPIANYPNFEHLEFRGGQSPVPFLEHAKKLAHAAQQLVEENEPESS